jgi:signal transduction histidine kinase
MGVRRPAGTARIEEQIVLEWKRYAGRKAGSPERVAEGACYLDPRACPFEARPDFETRFTKDCVHCARLQGAVTRIAPAPAGTSGAIPTLGLLLRLVEAEGIGSGGGSRPSEETEDSPFKTAAFLLRALPLLHAASGARRVARVLMGAIAGGFTDFIDTVLFLEVAPDGGALHLQGAFRRADLAIVIPSVEGFLDVETLAAGGAFDGEVFDRLRETPIPIDEDHDLLADAVLDGRTSTVGRPRQEIRLPTVLVDHLPPGPAVILPVFGRDRVRAVLVVGAAPGVAGWTGDQIELLSAVATQAGMAIEGGALADLSRRRGTALRAMQELGARLVKPGATDPAVDTVLRALADATESSHAVAWTRASDGSHAIAASAGQPDAGEADLKEIGETLRHWFEADPRAVLLDAIDSDPRFPGTLPDAWGTALAVPLRADDRVWGSFLLVREMRAGAEPSTLPYDAEDAALASLAATVASLAWIREAGGEALTAAERRLRDAEAQLRHFEKIAVVGERGIQVAQDIRNPISAISGFAKRILKNLGPENENKEYLEIILRETDRLERVLGEQLAMAQMTRPRLKLQNLNAIVQEALELHSDELVRRRVRLLKRLAPDLPSLLIDPDKIRHVLSNVLQYALQSVPSGGRVRVETRSGAGVVHAEIAHDGPKVAGETLDRLFVPFSMSRRYGAGVGLAVAYQMVREHGGEIRARSEGDWSSIVTIYLPVRENQDRRARSDRRGGRNDRRRRLA